MAPSWFAFVGLFLLGALALGGALVMVVNFDRNERRRREAKQTGTTHVTPADGNVFADLGFSPAEAAALLAESRRRIAAKAAGQQADPDLR